MKVAIYTRVSAAENKNNLDGQAKRWQDCCAAKGYPVAQIVKDIDSGLNDTRPKLLKLLTDPTLTRFGFNVIEHLLKLQDPPLETINLAESGKEDLVQDCVSMATSFCTRLYGPKGKTERSTA